MQPTRTPAEFRQRHRTLVWSNPDAADAIYLRRALIFSGVDVLLDAAAAFGLAALEHEWQALLDDGDEEAQRVARRTELILRQLAAGALREAIEAALQQARAARRRMLADAKRGLEDVRAGRVKSLEAMQESMRRRNGSTRDWSDCDPDLASRHATAEQSKIADRLAMPGSEEVELDLPRPRERARPADLDS
ncbi:hypothetical protein QOS04_23640 [Cupriavidus sp. LEh21]|nr:hypothetical protein [Cupriavidus sp. LEh21]